MRGHTYEVRPLVTMMVDDEGNITVATEWGDALAHLSEMAADNDRDPEDVDIAVHWLEAAIQTNEWLRVWPFLDQQAMAKCLRTRSAAWEETKIIPDGRFKDQGRAATKGALEIVENGNVWPAPAASGVATPVHILEAIHEYANVHGATEAEVIDSLVEALAPAATPQISTITYGTPSNEIVLCENCGLPIIEGEPGRWIRADDDSSFCYEVGGDRHQPAAKWATCLDCGCDLVEGAIAWEKAGAITASEAVVCPSRTPLTIAGAVFTMPHRRRVT